MNAITFARGGGSKSSSKGGKASKPGLVEGIVGAISGNDCGTGTVSGKKGFQKGNKCAGKGNRNPAVDAARAKHTAASRAVQSHVKAARKAGTPLSKEARASIREAAAAHRELRAAREANQAAKKEARNARRRETRAAAKASVERPEAKAALKAAQVTPPPGGARAKPEPTPKAEPTPRPEAKPTIADRVQKSAREVSRVKVEMAAEKISGIKDKVASGDEGLTAHIDRIGRGTTKDELFAAAKAAGIEHSARTKKDLIDHLKNREYTGGVDRHAKDRKAKEAPAAKSRFEAMKAEASSQRVDTHRAEHTARAVEAGKQAITKPGPASPEKAVAEIQQAYREVTGGRENVRAYIADLRLATPHLSPAEFDAGLIHGVTSGRLAAYPLQDPSGITPRDERHKAHTPVGDPLHIVYAGGR